jgi:hypothetical protein
MKLTEVSDRKSSKDFLRVPKILYRDDPYWVCPLDKDIESTFDPDSNRQFNNGDARRWILYDEKERLIGRIAAFYNRQFAGRNKQPTGGIGFFECINQQDAANLLFDAARNWLSTQGMEAMDGPINFGGIINHWGLLVEGFTHPGYGMPYNFPYYRELFENYGFQTYFRQYSYHIDITLPFPERFYKIAEWVAKKPDFQFEHATVKEAEKYVKDIVKVYNQAWTDVKEDFVPLNEEDLATGMRQAKAIVEEDLIWFVYHKGEPISFFIIYPDVNQIFKYFNGKINLINKFRFLYYKKKRKITRCRAVAAGVIPKFQNSGVESGIFKHLEHSFKKKHWMTEVELSWVGDFNPKMRSMYEAVGGELAKKHLTMRYLFDKNAEFERYMPDYMEKFKQTHSELYQEEITYDPAKKRPKYNYLKYKEL